jgi:hypothetical protein
MKIEIWEFRFFEPSTGAFGRLTIAADNETEALETFNKIDGLIHKGQWLVKFLGAQPCKQ